MSDSPTPATAVSRPLNPRPRAIVFCEGNFGAIDGKTANGLVRNSERFEIISVIDSALAGQDTGMVLDGRTNGIPLCRDLGDAMVRAGAAGADVFVVGVAPTSGLLSRVERRVLLDAMSHGLDLVNGLHEFLNDDAEFAAAAAINDVEISDVRRPRAKVDLRMFTGAILDVTCPRIAVLGTDGAIGKRTTATILTRALNASGVHAVLVGTGQTSLIQGARHGTALDAVPAQFVTGELEAAVVGAFETEDPDVIIVEGQGALSHPTYLSSTAILRGSRPAGVILQHAPARTAISDFPMFPMPTPASEINLIETFADTTVIGLTINHENMTDAEVTAAITMYELELGDPRHRCPDPPDRPSARHGVRGVPGPGREVDDRRQVSSPRLEIDLDAVGHNACALVAVCGRRGIAVTAVTKAMLGSPDLARMVVAAGVDGLGDARLENIERMRAAGVEAPMMLLRSPMRSQVERLVAAGTTTLNTEIEVVSALDVAARAQGRIHDVVIMVELGDLREGVMADQLDATVRHVLGLGSVRLAGIGANLACRSGIEPSDANMAELSTMADGLEATFGIEIEIVSGGNSANIDWLSGPDPTGRINHLRIGEAILLGCEPLRRRPIPGLRTDAFSLVGEVIESKRKPSKPWGTAGQNSFGESITVEDRGAIWQTILAIGRQDTDTGDLTPPTGVEILAASSDHLVVATAERTRPGDELAFWPGYSALLRSMTSPFVERVSVSAHR